VGPVKVIRRHSPACSPAPFRSPAYGVKCAAPRSTSVRSLIHARPIFWRCRFAPVDLVRGVEWTGTALQVYAYLMNVIQNEGDVYVRDTGHVKLERLHVV
jgi:hypothetical protein